MVKSIIDKEEAINKAIDYIKSCPYKGTGVKIELEANLNRESSRRKCKACGGTRNHSCSNCKGESDGCSICGGTNIVACSTCEGTGTVKSKVTMSIPQTDKFIMNHVSPEAREALVYHQTYFDGSVDTETTFTLKLSDVRYAIEFIKAFKDLAEYLQTDLNTSGAGMHICILNSPDCNYPGGNKLDTRRANNFKKSMTHLLPALFFLASSCHASRRLNYRIPQIALNYKYGAISGQKGCFEYRVFETCYDRPEAILDDLCVIANTLQFYHYREKSLPFFGKIGKFGFKDIGVGIERFYTTETNYAALMAGVKVLKPSYKSMYALRKERNFRITLDKIRKKETVLEAEWASSYEEFVTDLKKKNKFLEKECKEAYANLHKENQSYSEIERTKWTYGFTPAQLLVKYPTEEAFLNKFLPRIGIKSVPTQKKYIRNKKTEHEMELVTTVINV